MSDSSNLFDTQFVVRAVDPDGKKFDRVSRIVAHSPSLEMDLSLDIASELYPLAKDQQFTFLLASSLHSHGGRPTRTGAEGEGEQDEVSLAAEKDAWRLDGPGGGGLADEYDYVMYGKIYKYDEGQAETVTVYGSFGGLLMALTGSYRHVSNIVVGTNVYLLMRG